MDAKHDFVFGVNFLYFRQFRLKYAKIFVGDHYNTTYSGLFSMGVRPKNQKPMRQSSGQKADFSTIKFY